MTAHPQFERRLFTEPRDLWTELTETNRLLATLPPRAFDLLAPHLCNSRIEAGTVLHEFGQPVRDVYFPRQGLVGLLCPMPDGSTVETAEIGREGAVGVIAGMIPAIAHSRAVVHLPIWAAQISAARLFDVAVRSSPVRLMIVRYTDFLMAQAEQTAACNAMHSVHERLCRWLLQARDRLSSDLLPVTQEFLSEVLGVQRTTVTTASRVLQSQGIINVRRGRIHIRDLGALEGNACACYGALRRLTVDHSIVQTETTPGPSTSWSLI